MKRFLAAALMGAVAISLTIYEWDFGRRARVAQAVVIESHMGYRSGRTLADVLHVVNGQQVSATLRAWYCHLTPGQYVRVLYLPGHSEDVVLDRFWQRHYGSILALAAFTILVIAEAWRFAEWRRRRAIPLLRDDYVEPWVSAGRISSLPIDTAPRLWDHELDG